MTIRQGLMVCGTVPDEDAFSFAAEQGFDFVELDMEQAFPPQAIDIPSVCRTLTNHDLDVVVHLPYRLDPGSPHDHVRDGACRQLERAIDTAVELGAEKGIFHAESRGFPHVWGHETLRESLYESVRRLTRYARERDFEVCVENLKKDFFDCGDFPTLFAETNAVACLDTGHAYVTGHDADSQAALLRNHGNRISHLHLNDTRQTDDDEHLPVGLGKLNFEALATAMRETDWSGTCTHEVYLFDIEYAGRGKSSFDRLLSPE
ncbi:Sugar phosphate isomerase/epimerase [Haladaptatus litoreus]|uniref:Sugar phosphate isomerase/epimerase n=1 Tax=Haladaptatus litoreus TaxID=553468 RepID=A0A1N7BV62_9EURY|nr:sugar phosphate isomerase/epimerase family protein [Haladaptatus litoreus]SIR55146.1 Sugar phosphate isomerase/epimerase [Haladaptatus litoreus]